MVSLDIKGLLLFIGPEGTVDPCEGFARGVRFQAMSEIGTLNFMRLLEKYSTVTTLGIEGKELVQKRGACVGSQLEPILSDIYLHSRMFRIFLPLRHSNLCLNRTCDRTDFGLHKRGSAGVKICV